MNRLKKFFKVFGLICLIVLASMGIGAPISFNSREKYMNKEVKTEQSEVKDDESESELEEEKR